MTKGFVDTPTTIPRFLRFTPVASFLMYFMTITLLNNIRHDTSIRRANFQGKMARGFGRPATPGNQVRNGPTKRSHRQVFLFLI